MQPSSERIEAVQGAGAIAAVGQRLHLGPGGLIRVRVQTHQRSGGSGGDVGTTGVPGAPDQGGQGPAVPSIGVLTTLVHP